MFCSFCGKEVAQNVDVCPFCDGVLNEPPSQAESALLKMLKSAFSSSAFLAAAVLFTVSAGCSFVYEALLGSGSLPIVDVFIIFALFKLNSLSKSDAPLNFYSSPLKINRIIANVVRIILWVAAGVFAVCGALFAYLGFIKGYTLADLSKQSVMFETEGSALSEAIFSVSESAAFVGILGVAFLLAALICGAFALFILAPLYKCARAFEWTAGTGNDCLGQLKAPFGALVFLAVTGILSVVSWVLPFSAFSVDLVLPLISEISSTAALILFVKILSDIKKSRQIEIF